MDDLAAQYPYLDTALLAAFCGDGQEVDHEMLSGLNLEAMIDQQDHSITENCDPENEEKLEFLQHSFPKIDRSQLKKTLERCGNDSERAIDELLNNQLIKEWDIEPIEQMQRAKPTAKQQRKKRSETKAARRRRESIEFVAEQLQCSFAQAEATYDANEQSVGKCLVCVNLTTIVKRNNLLDGPSSLPSATNTTNTTNTTNAGSVSGNGGWRYQNHVLEESRQVLQSQREHAVEQLDKMARKARSDPLYRNAMGVYGSKASELSKQLHTNSDDMYFNEIERQSNEYRVDCHGIPAHVAVRFVEQTLQRWESRGCKAPLIIVTGSGIHSSGGVPKIKNMIRRRVNTGNYKYEEQSAGFKIIKCL